MPHGHGGKHHGKHKPESSGGQKEQSKLVGQQPAAGPWSRWIPQENGRYFYKGRVSARGQWEYIFTEGYPTGARSGSTYSTTGMSYPQVVQYPALQAVQLDSNMRMGAAQELDALPEYIPPPRVVDADSDDEWDGPIKDKSKGKSGAKKNGSSKHGKHKGSKKLVAVVMSDKKVQFNPKTKVNGWLGEISDFD